MEKRTVMPQEIVGHSRTHHKIVCTDECPPIQVMGGKKIVDKSHRLPCIYDTQRKVQDRLTPTFNSIVGYNDAGVLEVHWWVENLVIQE